MNSWPSRSATIGTKSWPGCVERESNEAPSNSTSGPIRRPPIPAAASDARILTDADGTVGRWPTTRMLGFIWWCCSAANRPSTTCRAPPRPTSCAPPIADRYRITPGRASPPRASGRSPSDAAAALLDGPDAIPGRLDPTGTNVSPTPMLADAADVRRDHRGAARCCTARWARTARCRACSISPTSPTSAAACSAPPCRWTRRWPSRSSPPPASPQARYRAFAEHEMTPGLPAQLVDDLGLPLFVKPANMGSSVGVSKATTDRGAARGDRPCAHLRRDDRRRGGDRRTRDRGRRARHHRPASVGARRDRSGRGVLQLRGQVRHRRRPAADPGAAVGREPPTRCRRLAIDTFRALRCDGLARVDFFYEMDDAGNGRGFLCNEVNTMPGFTPISMYPKLWIHRG